MIALTEPQVWTLIAVFATIMVGTQTLLITGVRSQIGSLRTELKADIGGLRGEMNARFERVDAQFERVDAQFAAVDARFDALTSKVDHLDRDVQLLMNREFGENRG
ncbi:MAG: hypothetical protein ACSLE3_11935 [Microbacteriaceae bacterium]